MLSFSNFWGENVLSAIYMNKHKLNFFDFCYVQWKLIARFVKPKKILLFQFKKNLNQKNFLMLII